LGLFQDAKAHFVASHQHPINQVLHHITNTMAIALIPLLFMQKWAWFAGVLVVSQILAWGGHAVFERNKPAFIQYPGITILASLSWSFDNWFGMRQILDYFANQPAKTSSPE